jgi:hypothetical protein
MNDTHMTKHISSALQALPANEAGEWFDCRMLGKMALEILGMCKLLMTTWDIAYEFNNTSRHGRAFVM